METPEHFFVMLLLCVCACSCASDYYSLLGVSRSASSREIKKAFHKVALKYHPDKNQSPDAHQAFTHIAHAYEVLSNKGKRKVYDQMDHITDPDQGRDSKTMGSNPYNDKGGFYSKSAFQHLSLQELLQMLQLDDDFCMGEEPNYEGWSYNFGAEDDDDDDDENVFLSDLFNML